MLSRHERIRPQRLEVFVPNPGVDEGLLLAIRAVFGHGKGLGKALIIPGGVGRREAC